MALGLALALAVLIGVSLGALGSGGAIVTLPVLVYVARVPAQSAVGMSMAIVGGTSLLGSYLYYRRGDFHRQATILFAVTGMVGVYLVPTTVSGSGGFARLFVAERIGCYGELEANARTTDPSSQFRLKSS